MASPLVRILTSRHRNKFMLVFIAIIAIYVYLVLLYPASKGKVSYKQLPGSQDTVLQKIDVELQPLKSTNTAALKQTVLTVQSSETTKPKGKLEDVKRSQDLAIRQEKVKEMMSHAWMGYRKCAWGWNEVMPINCAGAGGTFPGLKVGATIIDSLDTLYIMNMTQEFQDGVHWVENDLTKEMNRGGYVSVFEFNIRHLGGLLSAYALSGQKVLLEKAVEVANKLLPAFDTDTGIPDSSVHLKTGTHHRSGWASGAILSEFGSLHLEFTYLSQLTRNPIYAQKVQNVRKFLINKPKKDGMYPVFLDPKSGEWGSFLVSLGAFGDSFYEYLLKSYLQSNRKDKEALNMYIEAIRPVRRIMVKTSQGGLTYAGAYRANQVEPRMEHLTCFAGGMFALGAKEMPSEAEQRDHFSVGEQLTTTCHLSYNKTETGLGPESFRFDRANEAMSSGRDAMHYLQRPEVVESIFVMWRLTHDPKYREWGWQVVQAIERHCRVRYGFSGLSSVNMKKPPYDNAQQSFFLAETLKYLYLLFSDDDLLPLDKWVFNTEAHPLPVLNDRSMFTQDPARLVVVPSEHRPGEQDGQ